MLPAIVVTPGEPAGIGPSLCVILARERFDAHLVVVADKTLLLERARALDLPFSAREYDRGLVEAELTPGLWLLDVPLAAAVRPGEINPANAGYVLTTLRRAIEGCLRREFSALVTGPVHKGVINDAGIAFTGHTEFLAAHTGTSRVVMMLVGGGLRVALATTHLPLKDVPGAITQPVLEGVLRVLHDELLRRFRLVDPRILVAGLNPHAGESGHLGREEIEVIAPVLERLRAEGMRLDGPLPADTLFTPKHLAQADCVLAMYHDQGLPVLKMKSFGRGVNVTLGLPIIRTSVDHGTALDLATSAAVDIGSMREAVELAIELGKARGP
jgi:4-hydroxythreonine-4-phosphate dehydrogenase